MSRPLSLLFCLLATPALAANWSVQADPPAKTTQWPADLKVEIKAPSSFFDTEVTFAEQGGPFVALGRNGGKDDVRTFHDLLTGKSIGELRGDSTIEKRTLSPDGKLFAGLVGKFGNQAVTVFEVATGKSVAEVAVKGAELVVFIANDKLVYQAGFGDKNLHVIEANGGKEITTFAPGKGFRRCPPVFSPGGKYVAIAEGDEVILYTLADGSEAGRVSTKSEGGKPGEAPRFFNCEWLAFSPDGASLAAVSSSGHDPFVIVWSLADGKRVFEKLLEKPGRFAFYDGPKLEWVPDSSAWLLNGEAMYDREAGKVLWKVPESNPGRISGRHAIAANAVLYLDSKDRKNRAMKLATIATDKLTAIRESVRGGGAAVDALLPKLKEIDLDAAPEAQAALPGAAWTATPDASPATAQVARRPVPLTYQGLEVDSVFISSGDKPVAIFDLAKRDNMFSPASDAAARRIEAVSLTTGQVTNKVETPPGCKLMAISADGAFAVTSDLPEQRRVDVWSLATGKHVVGWRPFPKSAEKDRKVKFVGVSGDKVLAMNQAGSLVACQIADAKPVYRAALAGMIAPTMSPGGKYLVGVQHGVVRFIDAATGTVKGDLEPKGNGEFQELGPTAVAVRADGSEVAALFRKQGNTSPTIARWDAKGKLVSEDDVALAAFGTPDLQYAGDDNLLIDHRLLYDLKRKAQVWTYTMAGAGRFAGRMPDSRTWFASTTGLNGTASLVAAALPEPAVNDYVKAIIDGPNAILKPGVKVGVTLNFTGSHADGAKTAARDSIYRTLKDYGMLPGETGDLRLEVSVSQKETGDTMEFRRLFGGLGSDPRGRLTVKEIELDCKTVLSSGTETLWSPAPQKIRMREIYGIIRLPDKNTDLTDYLYKQVWDRVPGWAAGVGVPRYLAKTENGVVALPGTSMLQASGVVTQTPGQKR